MGRGRAFSEIPALRLYDEIGDQRGLATAPKIAVGDGSLGFWAALRKMFVAAPFRGRELGVAGKLLDALLAHARAQGIARIFLGTTDKFLAAHRFYEKKGFEELQKAELPKAFPVMAVDSKFYVLSLS